METSLGASGASGASGALGASGAGGAGRTAAAGNASLESAFSLSGKRALVTGASRGIGAAVALGFARAGADVALLARSVDELERVAHGVESFGRTALTVPCDVTVGEAVTAAYARTKEELGPIDVLVNNAGGPVFQSAFLGVREEGWRRVVDLNLTSVFRLCQLVGRDMVRRGGGSIINISSVAAARPWPPIAAYSVAKAGVVTLTQALASEWGGAGVRVNVVSPGWIRTEINRAYLENDALAQLALLAVPLGRWGEPEDVVGAALWLASEASRYVTGAEIAVDGGLAVGVPQVWSDAMTRPGGHVEPNGGRS